MLVKKNEMEEWQRKQEQLQNDLNMTKRKVENKLQESKMKFQGQLENLEHSKDLDIKDLEKRYEDLKR